MPLPLGRRHKETLPGNEADESQIWKGKRKVCGEKEAKRRREA
jgi:hypothetical protein